MAGAKKNTYLNNPNLPTAFSEHEYDSHKAKEIVKSKKDIIHFAKNYFYIVTQDSGRIKIPLRPYQIRVLTKMQKNRFFILLSPRQASKALALDTPIPTPSGWTTMGELNDGDQIFGQDGNMYNVTKAHDILYDRDCYEVEFDNGEVIVACGEHNWFTQSRLERGQKKKGSVKTTEQIFQTLNVYGNCEPNHRIPLCVTGLHTPEIDLPIPPYLLGLWLGDGDSSGGSITIGERDFVETMDNLNIHASHYDISVKYYSKVNRVATVRLKDKNEGNKSFSEILRNNGLIHNKHIPEIYFRASREQRLQLLQGLIDSDGYIYGRNMVNFCNTNIELAKQVKQLIESLGYKTNFNTYIPKLYGKECAECAVVVFTAREKVATLKFKVSKLKNLGVPEYPVSKFRNQWHYIKRVTKVDSVPVRCITVDSPDSLYLCGKTLIPTHNTTMYTIHALHHVCFNADKRVVIVANKEATAIEIFKRIKLAYEELPNWLKPGVDGAYGATSMKLANGSEISISTTTGSAARGLSISLLLVDEIAFIEPASILNDFWKSIYPTIAESKSGKILIASTPNGTGNLFHKIWTGAVAGQNEFGYDKIEWNEPPGRDEEFKRKTIQNLGSYDAWMQEFETTFLESGEGAIDHELFDKLAKGCKDPIYTEEDGLKVYEPYTDGRIYCAGIDSAEGVGKDASVVQIYDITDLTDITQVATYHNNRISVYDFTTRSFEILNNWGRPIVAIERNSIGSQVADRFKLQLGYENVICWGGKLANRAQQIGVIAHSNTKSKAVQNMRYWLNDLKCVRLNDIELIKELKEFERKPNATWGAKSGFHDDRVTSTMWALMALYDEICVQYFNVDEVDDNGKPKKISFTDWGLDNYMNPDSIYTQEALQSTDISVMPVMFGGLDTVEHDIEELQSLGWLPLDYRP